MKKYSDIYKEEGLIIKVLNDKSFIDDVKKLVKDRFNQSDEYYQSLSREEFQDIAVDAQDALNNMNIQEKFYNSEEDVFKEIFDKEELLHESVVFFRAVRPIRNGVKMEAPDFHRETFYSDHSHTPYCINSWIPIMNVNDKNTLQYYPKSHLIADEELKVVEDKDAPGKVEKFSSGHKLGFLWKPKKLDETKHLGKPTKMVFPENSYSIFSSMLIHGGAKNYSDKIRFAIGFGMIPAKKMTFNKKFFASNGKPHYVSF